jgi:hypothetical protein
VSSRIEQRADARWDWHPHACGCPTCEPERARAARRFDRTTLAGVAIGAAYILFRVIGS